MVGLGGTGGHLVPSTGGVGGHNRMEAWMDRWTKGWLMSPYMDGPIILVLGKELTLPSMPEVKKKTSTFSKSLATRGLCEKQIPLIRCPTSDMDGGNKAKAICQLWKVQSFCSTISSLALWGSRGRGGMFQDPGPASWVLRGARPQAELYNLEQS